MAKGPFIKISIPEPCSENWDKMSIKENGRHCDRCHKTIIDYTKFTNAELFELINNHKTIPCGRFYSSQLDSLINPPSKRKNNFFSKIAASVIAFFSLHSLIASPHKNLPKTTLSPIEQTDQTDSLPNKIIISGKIIDENGNKLEGAKVVFNGNKVVETNKEGNYEFEITDWTNRSYLLQYSFPGLGTISRSFHPYMKSSRYDITLEKPLTDGLTVTMGVSIPIYLNFPDTTFGFKVTDKTLSKESEDLIAELATQMRNNPRATITITGEVNSGKAVTTCSKMTSLVLKRLTDFEGISEERIKVVKDPALNKKQNVIKIESAKE